MILYTVLIDSSSSSTITQSTITMSSLSAHSIHLRPPLLPPQPQLLSLSSFLSISSISPLLPKPNISISFPAKPNTNFTPIQCHNTSDIEMVQTHQGFFVPKQPKVVVLWDLDNKPPRGPPFDAALALKRVAERFGRVVEISAYANRHAFTHLPTWVRERRQERRCLDVLERKGVITPPSEAYVCSVCGRKCKTHLDLKKHFKQLHERERQKKLGRMRQLKGKKRQKYKERYLDRNYKYEEAARELITPKVGYGLAKELRRAGVFVKMVKDKPQAADWALKRQMMHSMSSGIDWMVLVSDDSDFKDMLRRAGEASLGTVVVGDVDRVLGGIADLWIPWSGVENGEVGDKDLVPKRRGRMRESDWGGDGLETGDGLFSVSGFDGSVDGGRVEDLERIVDELVAPSSGYSNPRRRNSAFSDAEEDDGWLEDDDDDDDDDEYDQSFEYDDDDDELLDSEDEWEEEDR